MDSGPLDLRRARILVTNDDGIHAPGLKVLERVAKQLTDDVWVVAPASEQSATSHSLTVRRPLRKHRHGPRRFAVDGTPTDCVLVARNHILRDHLPDLVLSGINHGANLGEDVHYSGTVTAALEAAMLGMRAIAFSQVRIGGEVPGWRTAETFGPDIVRRLVAIDWPRDLLVNVNFPPLPPGEVSGIRPCRQGRREEGRAIEEGADPAGRPYLWIGGFLSGRSSERKTDLSAVMEGAISVTPLHLDLTHRSTLKTFAGLFK